MTDLELIEGAVKAAGFPHPMCREAFPEDGEPFAYAKLGKREYFRPLSDDGDAFRLAVKLGLTISSYKRGLFVSRDGEEPVIREEWGEDDAQTTRRAIVRFAAAISEKS